MRALGQDPQQTLNLSRTQSSLSARLTGRSPRTPALPFTGSPVAPFVDRGPGSVDRLRHGRDTQTFRQKRQGLITPGSQLFGCATRSHGAHCRTPGYLSVLSLKTQ